MSKFEKGNPGKPKGAVSKLSKTVKERVLDVFNELQGTKEHNLFEWAKTETTEFYKIAAKLIPADINAKVETTVEQVFKINGVEIKL